MSFLDREYLRDMPEIHGKPFLGRNNVPEIQGRPFPGRNIVPEIRGRPFLGMQ